MSLCFGFNVGVGMPWVSRQNKFCITNIPTNTQNLNTWKDADYQQLSATSEMQGSAYKLTTPEVIPSNTKF